MSEIEIGLRVFWLCLTFGFLTLLMVVIVFWHLFPGDKERDEREREERSERIRSIK